MMLCNELHCQKFFKLKLFSYKIGILLPNNQRQRTPRRTCCHYACALTTVPRVSRPCELVLVGFDLHLLRLLCAGTHRVALQGYLVMFSLITVPCVR